MKSFQRFIGQVTYDMSRKRNYTRRKRGQIIPSNKINFSVVKAPSLSKMNRGRNQFVAFEGIENMKKLIGILLIAVGVILIFSKCSGGLKAKEEKSSKETTKVEQQISKGYIDYMQDLNIGAKTLDEMLKLSLKYQKDYAYTLAVWAVESYKGVSNEEIKKCIKEKDITNLLDEFGMYDHAAQVYKQFIYDIECFPIKEKNVYTYKNGWKEARSYKGDRLHYGIDIMSKEEEAGKIQVRSMTDGVVENIGWNQVGGYRVGIRSENGAYFYYAHLDSYPKNLKQEDRVKAGQVIGLMGDTGYGEEGTRGKFPVHLHIGIAVKTPSNEEFWVNPYSILEYLETK
nr:M23 family metallopeptidase [uncultured Niameybacter sp.]